MMRKSKNYDFAW